MTNPSCNAAYKAKDITSENFTHKIILLSMVLFMIFFYAVWCLSLVSSRSRGNVGRSRCGSRLGLKIRCLGLVSVSYHRVSFTSQYAQLFASLPNCTCIVLNAGRLYCLLIHKVSFTSLLHTFAIAMQYTIKKVLFLDFANEKIFDHVFKVN